MTDEQHHVSSVGGGYFAGPVTAGHDVIGGDKVVSGDEVENAGVSVAELAQLFQTVYARIESPGGPRKADAVEVKQTVERIEREAAKGDQASGGSVERWLSTLAEVAPDVLEVAVNALTNPGAAVSSAVRLIATRFGLGSANAP
jgi:hypothetical protein